MKVLFYVAELQSVDETKAKEDLLFLWANANEVDVVGVVYELNASNTLGECGQGAIIDILHQYDVDAVVIAGANDFAVNKANVCVCVKAIREMGADVISVANDLPRCEECLAEMMCESKEAYRRAYHCTVKIFHE
ncbi:MAG: hypothetical protein IJE43_20350 [Alphaproteobacteria bacterium]|nr:hypothetical protein [Alphaproteobacteria bacterium]